MINLKASIVKAPTCFFVKEKTVLRKIQKFVLQKSNLMAWEGDDFTDSCRLVSSLDEAATTPMTTNPSSPYGHRRTSYPSCSLRKCWSRHEIVWSNFEEGCRAGVDGWWRASYGHSLPKGVGYRGWCKVKHLYSKKAFLRINQT